MTGIREGFNIREHSELKKYKRVLITREGPHYTYFPCPSCPETLQVEHKFTDGVFSSNCQNCGWSGNVKLYEERPNLDLYTPEG